MSTASDIALKVRKEFFQRNLDLLSCLDKTPDEVLTICMAAAELDRAAREEVIFFGEGLDQRDPFAKLTARDDFKRVMYEITARFLVQAIQDGVIKASIEFTPEADAQLRELSFVLDPSLRPAPPPKPRSAEEQLDEQIRDDWQHLSADKIRLKENDPKYKRRLRELLDSDAIKSQATTLHDAGQVGG